MPHIQDYHLHFHLPQYHFDHSPNMRILYGMRFLRDVVFRLTSFFVPIYLYQLVVDQQFTQSFSLFSHWSPLQGAMIVIALFYGLCRLIVLVSAIPLAQIGSRFGHATALFMSHILFAGYLGLLFASKWMPWLIFVAAVLDGLHAAQFWPTYQTLLSKSALKSHLGQDLGIMQFLVRLGSLVAPAIGGVFIVFFGFANTFLLGMVGILLSASLVLLMHNEPERDVVSLAECMRWLKERTFDRLSVTYAGRYINDAVLALWPIYVYLFIGKIESVGYLFTFSLLIAMVINFIVGFRVDHQKNKKPFIISGMVLSALWLARAFVGSFWHLIAINTLDRCAGELHWLTYDTFFMRRGQGSQAYSFFVYREVMTSLSAMIFWLLVIVLFIWVDQGWTALFSLAAVGVILTLFIQDKYQASAKI